MALDIRYSRPSHTNKVKGSKTVGRTTDGDYHSVAEYAGTTALGIGDSPEAARSDAAGKLVHKLDTPPVFAR